jgi:hypothetical protein
MNTDLVTDLYDEDRLKKLQGYNAAVYHSKNALFLSAGMLLVIEIISYAFLNRLPDNFYLLLFIFMFTTFVGLALWTKKKPYTALRIGAIVYVVYILLNALPFLFQGGVGYFFTSLFRGILYKIIIIGLIAKAAPKAKAMQTLNESIDQ